MKSLLYLLYNLIMFLATIFILIPYLIYLAVQGRFLEIRERLGLLKDRQFKKSQGKQIIWIQAASVGEVKVADQLIKELKSESDQSYFFILTVMTPAGRSLAIKDLSGIDIISYLPFDFYPLIKLFIKRLQPDLLLLIETELWPGLINQAASNGVKISLVNGRLSDKSFPRYNKLQFFFRPFLRLIDRFYMQSSTDSRRIIELGARPEDVENMVNLKYGGALDLQPGSADKFNSLDKKKFVAGSSHPPEEKRLISIYQNLDATKRPLLILAPRHIERRPEIEDLLNKNSLNYQLWSKLKEKVELSAETEVIVVDTIGDLTEIYSYADLAFIGGTIADVGGHNFLEPLSFQVPVLIGPNQSNIRSLLKDFADGQGIHFFNNTDQLADKISSLLADEDLIKESGRSGYLKLEEKAREIDKLTDSILRLMPLGPGKKKTLFIRLSAIGDIVHTLPAFSLLKENRPEYKLHWLVEELTAPLLQHQKDIDQVKILPKSKWRGRNKLPLTSRLITFNDWTKRLQQEKYDLSFDLHGLFKSALPAYLAHPGRTYGPARGKEASSLFYQKKFKGKDEKVHQIEKYLAEVASSLGIKLDKDYQIDYGLSLPPEWDINIPENLLNQAFIIIHPRSSWASKDWTLERYFNLVEDFLNKGINIVISGGPAEAGELAAKFEPLINKNQGEHHNGQLFNLAGKLSLIEQFGLSKAANLFIGGDTGPLHLAAASGTTCLALMGPTDPVTHGPYGQDNLVIHKKELECINCWERKCPLKTNRCMDEITTQEVKEAAIKLFSMTLQYKDREEL
ncbi:glycosyltransferase [Halanaerobiaceae bacterium Z-7014]|uniref:Glycosyltransferase n=1 Tax=Halonatronomonas betaini TaxID=2778430 RepID=A0A931FAC0_9FIRM|nr:glycosyltransferase N-terminal domain-containing protein [Halonatronomonas betaini]MBF8437444.1 glycosyltransferase [Halonatronomonas betaini]